MTIFTEYTLKDAALYMYGPEGDETLAGHFATLEAMQQSGRGGSGTATGFAAEDAFMRHFMDVINGYDDLPETVFTVEGDFNGSEVRFEGVKFWSMPVNDDMDGELELTFDRVV